MYLADTEGAGAHGRPCHCAGLHHHLGLLAGVAAQNANTPDPVWRRGGANPPVLACHALSAHRLRSHERVMLGYDCDQQSSRRRAPGSKAAHPKQQLSVETLVGNNYVKRASMHCKEISGLNQQLMNWGYTTAHRGVTQGVCSSFRPRCTPITAQHICVLEQCCPDERGHSAWWLFEQRCQ